MPERKAQQRLTRIITDIRSRKFPYKPKPAKRIDWAAYDAAQLNEMNDYLTLVREVVDEIHREIGDVDQGNVGKPPKSAFDRAKAVLLQQYFEAGNRVAAGLARLFAEKLGIPPPPPAPRPRGRARARRRCPFPPPPAPQSPGGGPASRGSRGTGPASRPRS